MLSLACLAIAAGAMRSERFAERVGRLSGRVVTWAQGIVGRPSSTDFAAVAVRFRAETIDTVRGTGLRLLGVILLKYIANAAALAFALRAVGVPRDPLTIAGAFAAYSLVRLWRTRRSWRADVVEEAQEDAAVVAAFVDERPAR